MRGLLFSKRVELPSLSAAGAEIWWWLHQFFLEGGGLETDLLLELFGGRQRGGCAL